jgi:hypothetical protein
MLMVVCTKESIRTIRCTAEECFDMLMALCTKASVRTIRCTAEE